MIKKEIQFQGLNELPAYILDESVRSPNYFNLELPDELTTGKNVIKIRGSSTNLIAGSQIMVEILDSNRSPVYYEIPEFTDDSGAKLIIVYVYDDTGAGDAFITIMGEAALAPDGSQIPIDQRDIINLKWERKITVRPEKRNDTDIRFPDANRPIANVVEIVRPYLDRNYGSGQFVSQSSGQLSYTLNNNEGTLNAIGFEFNKDMEGGTLFMFPTGSEPSTGSKTPDSRSYQTTVKRVLNAEYATVDKPYSIPLSQYAEKLQTVNSFDASAYNISYEAFPTFSITENSRSYAYVNIQNLETLSGEVFRMKSYAKSAGSVGIYELIDDSIIGLSDYQQLLIDTASIDVKKEIGTFLSQTEIDNYWTGSLYQAWDGINLTAPIISNTNIPTLSFTEVDPIPRSLQTNTTTQWESPFYFMKIENVGSSGTFNIKYTRDGIYRLSMNAYAKATGSQGLLTVPGDATNTSITYPKVKIYLSGSSFDYDNGDELLGKYVGMLDGNAIQKDSVKSGDVFRFDDIGLDFIADKTGDGILVFKVESGQWNFANIKINPFIETGFSPSQTTLMIPLNTEQLNDELDFKFEYFDYKNNQALEITETTNVIQTGGNTYIQGGFNLLTGSLFVAGGTNSGIEIKGEPGGGLVRSIGYTGFANAITGVGTPGIMMWSGSVLPAASDNYNDVGLEIHGGGTTGSFLRFRTSTGKLEIGGDITADYYQYRQVILTTANSGSYIYHYNWGTDHDRHKAAVLDISGESGSAVTYVRFENNPDYPITHIIAPSGSNLGSKIILESYGPAYTGLGCSGGTRFKLTLTKASPVLPNGQFPKINVNHQIISEDDDWIDLSFENYIWQGASACIVQPTTSIDAYEVHPGSRVELISGDNGWRVQSSTNYQTTNLLLSTVVFATQSTAPHLPNSSAASSIYQKGDNIIIVYNDAGTIRYKYLNLSGTGTAWAHSTTEP